VSALSGTLDPCFYERMPCFTLWGRTLKVETSKIFTRSTFTCRDKGKDVSSFEKVLLSAGTDMSGDINEDKEVSEWIWMGSSVTEVLDFLEYVFVGTRT
jgi:hypothetical protein